MLSVGLTGGIGSGKSEVARRLAGYGALVVDADALAREVVAPGTSGLRAVVQAFGAQLLRPDGSLDRERLADMVFSDAAARRRLESIVHPLVAARTAEITAAVPPGSVVVNDVPLLVEKGLDDCYDLVVVVDAAEETQLARLMRLRGMSEDAARARLAAQATRKQRLAVADVVISNDGPLDALDPQVEELWARLRGLAGHESPSGPEPGSPSGPAPGCEPESESGTVVPPT